MSKKTLDPENGKNKSITTTVSEALLAEYDALAKEITDRKQKAFQDLITQHNIEWSKLLEYSHYDLSSLVSALTSSSPQVFTDYMGWAAALFKSNNIPFDLLKKI